MSQGSCNGCGRCCDPVVLPFTPAEVRTLAMRGQMDVREARFVLEDLTLIQPRRVGVLATADYLKAGGKTSYGLDGQGAIIMFSWFYECRWYDKDNRTCTNYDNRPDLCSGYPWYDEHPQTDKAIPRECGYVVDVGQVPIPLIRKEDRT